jgi:hypothetical protein
MPAFDKRAFLYVRMSDEYGTNHPNYSIMKMNGFSVPCFRPVTTDPLAPAAIKEARKQGLCPALWETPKTLANDVREDPIVFANRLSGIVADLDKDASYIYGIICDNEDLPLDWHEAFAPALAVLRSRPKILSINPLMGDMWGTENMYVPYVANGFSIDIQCYNDKMEYFDVSRCLGVVLGTPGVLPWKVRVTLPPGNFDKIILSNILKLGPIGIGLFAPSTDQITNELPKWGEYISGSVLPRILAYK